MMYLMMVGKPKTLLLDLDETLIHSCLIKNRPDVVLTYQGAQGEPTRVYNLCY